MTGPCFVDTNVFVCARDASEASKQPLAERWLERLWKTQSGRISVQILNEYFVTVTQKLSPGLPREEAWEDVTSLFAWNPLLLDRNLMDQAREVQDDFKISWWDSLVVAAGQISGCRLLLSEDLQDSQKFGELQVVNPFLHSPDTSVTA